MNLSQQDADQFYQLMWGLQNYVNHQLQLVDGVSTPDEVGELPQDEKVILRNAVYEHSQLITDYTRENPDKLEQESLDIVAGWVSFISGDFYIERYLKNHAIFMGADKVFAVKALYDPFDIIIPKSRLPCSVSAVLLPFKGQIVFDGLMFGRNIYFGGNMTASMKDDYLRAKQNGRIIDTWPPSVQTADKARVKTTSWAKDITRLQKAAKPLKGGAGQPPLNSPAFSLVKNSIELANQAVQSADADTLRVTLKSIKRAVTQIENILYRME